MDTMAHTGSQETTDLGNTKTKSDQTKRISASSYWCFTLNNPTEAHKKSLIDKLNDLKCKFIIGNETGENGTPHLQGYIESPKKIRPIETFEIKEIHWEKRKGSREDNIKYCSKQSVLATTFPPCENTIIDTLKEEDLFDWQKKIVNIIQQKPDTRTIYWIWENKGCTGKTTFCKYLSLKYNAIPLEGKKNDILYCAAEFNSQIYVWDLERSMETYVSYAALEKIKNGYYMCSKYESKPVIRNAPHVFCFANFAPDTKALSLDRWQITDLSENTAQPEKDEIINLEI